MVLNLRAAAAQTSELPTTTFVKVAALAFEESYSYTRQESDMRTGARVDAVETPGFLRGTLAVGER